MYAAHVKNRTTKETLIIYCDHTNKTKFAEDIKADGYILHFVCEVTDIYRKTEQYYAKLEKLRKQQAEKRRQKRIEKEISQMEKFKGSFYVAAKKFKNFFKKSIDYWHPISYTILNKKINP